MSDNKRTHCDESFLINQDKKRNPTNGVITSWHYSHFQIRESTALEQMSI